MRRMEVHGHAWVGMEVHGSAGSQVRSACGAWRCMF